MGMEWEAVDEIPAAKRGGGRKGSKWDEVVENLRKHAGQTFIVFSDESRPKVQGAHRYLTTQYTHLGDITAKTRTNPDTGKVELYARFEADE